MDEIDVAAQASSTTLGFVLVILTPIVLLLVLFFWGEIAEVWDRILERFDRRGN